MKFSWKNFPFFAEEVKPVGNEYSEMWEIYPPGMYDLLKRIWDDYYLPARPNGKPMPELMVTENGVPVPDVLDRMDRSMMNGEYAICVIISPRSIEPSKPEWISKDIMSGLLQIILSGIWDTTLDLD